MEVHPDTIFFYEQYNKCIVKIVTRVLLIHGPVGLVPNLPEILIGQISYSFGQNSWFICFSNKKLKCSFSLFCSEYIYIITVEEWILQESDEKNSWSQKLKEVGIITWSVLFQLRNWWRILTEKSECFGILQE